VPGHSNGVKIRGEENPSADASLDYLESNQAVISWIRQMNRRILTDYPLPEDAMKEGLVPTPVNLWNWGCLNRSGRRKVWPKEELMKLCLPTVKADLTRDGVRHGSMYYEPPEGVLPQFADWCARAAVTGSWKMTVSYHPGSFSDFWLHHDGEMVKLQLTPRSQRFAAWSQADHDGYKKSYATAVAEYRAEVEIFDIAREWERQAIINGGAAKTEAARGSVAKRRREKSDRAATTEDAKRMIASPGAAASIPLAQPAAPTSLQDEDEDDIVRRMEGTE